MNTEKKTECFGLEMGRCRVLTKTDCQNCPFYKTKRQFELDRAKSNKRLKKLGMPVVDFNRVDRMRRINSEKAKEYWRRKKGEAV